MSKRSGLTWIELCVVVALAAILVVLLSAFLPRMRAAAPQAECANNLKQLGVIFRLYAAENKDLYPALTRRYRTAPETGQTPWIFLPDESALYPRYATDPGLFRCPAAADGVEILTANGDWVDASGQFDPSLLDDRYYLYAGYAVTVPSVHRTGVTIDELAILADSLLRPMLDIGTPCNGEYSRATAYALPEEYHLPTKREPRPREYVRVQLREGIERYLITDNPGPGAVAVRQSDLAILWDRPDPNAAKPFTHGDGGNVLYMDGHVEFVPYPSKIPMTPAFVNSATLKP